MIRPYLILCCLTLCLFGFGEATPAATPAASPSPSPSKQKKNVVSVEFFHLDNGAAINCETRRGAAYITDMSVAGRVRAIELNGTLAMTPDTNQALWLYPRIETFSMITSFWIILVGLLGLFRTTARDDAQLISMLYAALTVQGFGSVLYHSSFVYGFRVWDSYSTIAVYTILFIASTDQVRAMLLPNCCEKSRHLRNKGMSNGSNMWLPFFIGVLFFIAACAWGSVTGSDDYLYLVYFFVGFFLVSSLCYSYRIMKSEEGAAHIARLEAADDAVLENKGREATNTTLSQRKTEKFETAFAAWMACFWFVMQVIALYYDSECTSAIHVYAHALAHLFYAEFVINMAAFLEMTSADDSGRMANLAYWPSCGCFCLCWLIPIVYVSPIKWSKESTEFFLEMHAHKALHCNPIKGCCSVCLMKDNKINAIRTCCCHRFTETIKEDLGINQMMKRESERIFIRGAFELHGRGRRASGVYANAAPEATTMEPVADVAPAASEPEPEAAAAETLAEAEPVADAADLSADDAQPASPRPETTEAAE